MQLAPFFSGIELGDATPSCSLDRFCRWAGASRTGSEEFFDVFAEEIGFEVDLGAGGPLAQGGDLVGVRDDPDPESARDEVGDGEADAVQGDRSFEDDIAHDVGRGGDIQEPILAGPFPAEDCAQSVDVAGHEVAAQLGRGAEGALEVDEGSDPAELEVGADPGFLEEIEAEEAVAPARGDADDGEAAAVDGEAMADAGGAAADSAANGQLDGPVGGLDALDGAGFFDNTCEHGGW